MRRNLFNRAHLIVQLVSAECARLIQAQLGMGRGREAGVKCGHKLW